MVKRSLERAMGDRLYELSDDMPCAKDAFFQRLHTLDGAIIERDHDYLIGAIEGAKKAVSAHHKYANQIIAHIEAEKARVIATSPCRDIVTGAPLGPVIVQPCTQCG